MTLQDESPEADYENISSVLYPGGIDAPSRLYGESTMSYRYGKVIGWFTIQTLPVGDHPEEIKKSWLDVPLPVREEWAFDLGEEVVAVHAVDAFNALADSRSPEEVLEYWANTFKGGNPTLYFKQSEGILENNTLAE